MTRKQLLRGIFLYLLLLKGGHHSSTQKNVAGENRPVKVVLQAKYCGFEATITFWKPDLACERTFLVTPSTFHTGLLKRAYVQVYKAEQPAYYYVCCSSA